MIIFDRLAIIAGNPRPKHISWTGQEDWWGKKRKKNHFKGRIMAYKNTFFCF